MDAPVTSSVQNQTGVIRKMRWMMLVKGLILALSCFAQVEMRTVGFAPNFYSFEEIAQRLSTDAVQVRCAPTLRQRVAYLSLKPRSWTEVKSLLERGLHLTIRPDPKDPKIWWLERSPESLKREQHLRERFCNILQNYLTYRKPNRYPNWGEVFSSLPVSVQESDLLNLRSQFQELGAAIPDSEASEPDGSLAAQIARRLDKIDIPTCSPDLLRWAQQQAKLPKHEFVQRFGTYFGNYFWDKDETLKTKLALAALAEAFPYRQRILFVHHAISNATTLSTIRTVLREGIVFTPVGIPIDESLLQELTARPLSIKNPLPADPSVVVEHTFTLDACNRTMRLLYGGQLFVLPDNGGYFEIPSDAEGLEHFFEEIDKFLATDYKRATELCTRVLQTTPTKPVSAGKRRGFLSLYEWLIEFSDQYQEEVIAEVFPRCALLDFPKQLSLRDLSQHLKAEGAWRVDQVEGVWIWRNWLEFIDRAPDLPLATLMQLVRSPRTPNDWRRFTRQVSPRQARWLSLMPNLPNTESLFGSSEWLGPMSFVAQQWLLFQVLDAVPQWEHRLKRTRELTVAWRELAPATRQRWGKQLFEVGTGVLPEAFHPWVWLGRGEEFAQWLGQEGTVWVSRSPMGVVVSVRVGEQELLTGVIPLKLEQQ